MKQFYKKVLVSLFIVYFMGLQFFTVPQKSDAAIPLVLTPMIISYIGASLIAAGIIVTNTTELENMATVVWDNLSVFNRELITTVVAQQQYIPGNFIALIWDKINIWYNSIVLNSQPIVNIPTAPLNWTTIIYSHNTQIQITGDTRTQFQNFLNSAIAGSSLTLFFSIHKLPESMLSISHNISLHSFGGQELIRNFSLTRGQTSHFVVQLTINQARNGFFFWTYNNLGNLLYTNWGGAAIALTANNLSTFFFWQPNTTVVTQVSTFAQQGPFVVTNLNNPAVFTPNSANVSHKNNLPNLKMYIPPAILALGSAAVIDWLLNRDFTSLQQETGVIQSAIPVQDSLVGIAGIMQNVLTGILAIPTSIARFFDFSIPVNLNPLVIAGSTLTTRFPFSIPFDLAKAFTGMSAMGNQSPEFVIDINDGLLGRVNLVISLEQFHGLIQITRTFLLVMFVVGLILLTPKILRT